MRVTNKTIIAGAAGGLGLYILFAGVLPALVSAPSTEAVALAAIIIFTIIVCGLILVRNAFGLKPDDINRDN